MHRIVKILMDRDGMSREEAAELVRTTHSEIMEAISNGDNLDDVEMIISNNLGLEPDFVEDFIL